MPNYISIGPKDGEKFDKVISKKQALVKFHLPNCPYCIEVTPLWNHIRQKYRNQKHFNIIDVNGNALQNINAPVGRMIHAFPQILLVNTEGKIKKEFIGERSLPNMIKFIESIPNNVANRPSKLQKHKTRKTCKSTYKKKYKLKTKRNYKLKTKRNYTKH